MKKAIIISTLTLGCHKPTPPTPPVESPVTTVNPPAPEAPKITSTPKTQVKPPNILHNLPTWDDISAPPTMKDPFAILALSSDMAKCYKEWHTKSSLADTVIANGGRILSNDETIIGRLIQCPTERKERLLEGNN